MTTHSNADHAHDLDAIKDTHTHQEHSDSEPHSTLKGYLTGFILAVVLTGIPFWMVMGNVLGSPATTGLVIMGFAVAQVVVHMIYFLHMNTKMEKGWSLLALLFTALLLGIMLSGSIWVMYHLNHNMMPGMMSQEISHDGI
jgi:cytochrome o ubiquinol oxidase operon protein cyoD